jgi:YHS domain-containing protein
VATSEYKGKTYYFCVTGSLKSLPSFGYTEDRLYCYYRTQGCKIAFDKNPERCLGKEKEEGHKH